MLLAAGCSVAPDDVALTTLTVASGDERVEPVATEQENANAERALRSVPPEASFAGAEPDVAGQNEAAQAADPDPDPFDPGLSWEEVQQQPLPSELPELCLVLFTTQPLRANTSVADISSRLSADAALVVERELPCDFAAPTAIGGADSLESMTGVALVEDLGEGVQLLPGHFAESQSGEESLSSAAAAGPTQQAGETCRAVHARQEIARFTAVADIAQAPSRWLQLLDVDCAAVAVDALTTQELLDLGDYETIVDLSAGEPIVASSFAAIAPVDVCVVLVATQDVAAGTARDVAFGENLLVQDDVDCREVPGALLVDDVDGREDLRLFELAVDIAEGEYVTEASLRAVPLCFALVAQQPIPSGATVADLGPGALAFDEMRCSDVQPGAFSSTEAIDGFGPFRFGAGVAEGQQITTASITVWTPPASIDNQRAAEARADAWFDGASTTGGGVVNGG